MAPSALTINWEALVTSTLFNWQKSLEDQISTSTALLYQLMKRQKGGYVTLADIGERAAYPLMYELGQADAYNGYDVLPTTPMDGITAAFFDWRQAAVAIAISGREKLINSGSETRIFDLLEGKMNQARLGLEEFFDKRLLIGAGGSTITTAYTSASNGAAFIDPLPLLVAYDPTTSTVIGNINQLTYSWWRNQTKNSTSSTYAGFLKEVRSLINLCSKGPGGPPNFFVTDLSSYELYEAALAASHRNPSYQRADIPFDNIAIKGQPLVWDEFTPDAQGGSATQSTTSGTLYALNTKFIKIQVHKSRNFSPTKSKDPVDQDATLQHILWFGAACVSNRRKQGVMGGIDTTIVS